MLVLLAFDSFKGAFPAIDACRAARRALERIDPSLSCDLAPIADGGEGTIDAIAARVADANGLGELRRERAPTVDPLGRPIESEFALLREPSGYRIALVETASASGLGRLAAGERDPWRASTFGTGLLMMAALAHGEVEELVVGLGGSATNDGGCGMAAALGWRFLDKSGREIVKLPELLSDVEQLAAPREAFDVPVTAAGDVGNPLLGPEGATRVFGTQKGVRPEEIAAHEHRLERFASLVARETGRDCRDDPGAGAAGGLGFALAAFLGARRVSGFEFVAERIGLARRVAAADLVLTGEGSLDGQTRGGKGPSGVAALAHSLGRPVIAFAGKVDLSADDPLRCRFLDVVEVRPAGWTVEQSIAAGTLVLEEAITRCETLRGALRSLSHA